MGNDVEFAVTRLTEPHTVTFEGRPVGSDALLVMLRDGIRPSLGAGGSGGGGDGQVLNAKAFTLYEHIDGLVRAWLGEYGQETRGDLCAAVSRLFGTIETERAGGRIEDDLDERLMAMFTTWVWEIEDMFNPASVKEVMAPCPSCGERYELTEKKDRQGKVTETTRQAAVRIQVKPGRALIAECHCCGALWVSKEQLVMLAAAVGAVSNFDTLE